MQLPESAEFASLVCRMRTAPDEKAASFLADLAAKGQVSPAEASQMLAKHNAKQAYETSMAMLDALLVDMKNGTVGPPKNPAPVAAAGKEKGKAPAKAPPAAPPAAAAGATAAGKQDKKKEGGAQYVVAQIDAEVASRRKRSRKPRRPRRRATAASGQWT